MKQISDVIKHFPNIEFSDKYLEVLKELSENENACINIIGNAGSGKSTLLGIIHYAFEDENIVTCATTGVASALLNASHPEVKATTIHSMFGLKAQPIFSSLPDYIKDEIRELIENMEILIIDEISMANCSLLDYVLKMIYVVRRTALKKNEMPRIILFGDVLQLPPVIKKKDIVTKNFFDDEYNGKYFYFNSKLFKKLKPKIVQLSKIYRQEGDSSFKDVLNRIRVNKTTEDDLKLINTRVVDECEFMADNENAIRLVTTNRDVEKWNRLGAEMIDCKPTIVRASFENENEVKRHSDYKEELYPDCLSIKIGSPVMITRNEQSDVRTFVNGDIGILEDLTEERAIVKLENRTVTVPRMETSFYDYGVTSEKDENQVEHKKVKAKEIGKYINIPIRSCFSSTIHKCQGRTISKCIIDFGDWITPSIVYVALSRVRNLNDICLIRPLTFDDIQVNTEAIEWLDNFTENEDEKMTDNIKEKLMNMEKENILESIRKWEEKYNCKW